MTDISLIANTGLQFFSEEIIFDPSNPVEVRDLPLSPLTFVDIPISSDKNKLSLGYSYNGRVYTLQEMRENDCVEQIIYNNGIKDDKMDASGVPIVDFSKVNPNVIQGVDSKMAYSENTINGMMQIFDQDNGEYCSPFSKILGKWIPAPMFLCNADNSSTLSCPSQWCRLRITFLEKMKQGGNRYRFEWAFDTTTLPTAPNLSDDVTACKEAILPFFKTNSQSQISFALANRIGHLLTFTNTQKELMAYFGDLIFGKNNPTSSKLPSCHIAKCRHIAYYISLFTSLRALGAFPKVAFYKGDIQTTDPSQKSYIPVDLILDIGNSRTCGLLVENEDFSRSELMNLRDMSFPYKTHSGSFDMRLAFHKAEFGDGNMGVSTFKYSSLLRIGEEAKWLISNSARPQGLSKKLMHHSSPKRYLWDLEKSDSQWEFLQLEDAITNIQTNAAVLPELSSQLNSDGSFRTAEHNESTAEINYSRRSLMTFVFVEIFQQAEGQINSNEHLSKFEKKDCRRKVENIIITCPTAMPEAEQKTLRQCALDAKALIARSTSPNFYFNLYMPSVYEPFYHIIPKPADIANPQPGQERKNWSYDEASCCQYVYLYSEIIEKYNGNCEKFIQSAGHIRSDLRRYSGYDKKSLTIGSVDIGAGTTDLMICAYEYSQHPGTSTLKPIPLFWDSFYVAGDDILNEIVRRVVLYNEPDSDEYREGYGSLFAALAAHKLRNCSANTSDNEKRNIIDRASSEIKGFFSKDHNLMTEEDRRMRNEFNTQISVPIAQKMLDMMKNGEMAQDLTYEQIFTQNKPSHLLLEYAQKRFDLDITQLRWSYSPKEIEDCIMARMERLLKQLSIILSKYNCDVVLLAGRPMSLEPITDFLLGCFPVAPNKLIRMLPKNENAKSLDKLHNCYKVGTWFPSHDADGYFKDLKPIVAAGAYVGYLASNLKLPQMRLDMSEMKKRMVSTAEYMGSYDCTMPILRKDDLSLTPDKPTAQMVAHALPHYIVTKQINTEYYEARPIYCLTLKHGTVIPDGYDMSEIRFSITRSYKQSKENLTLMNVMDRTGKDCTNLLELREQSLILLNGKNEYWLDNGVIFI